MEAVSQLMIVLTQVLKILDNLWVVGTLVAITIGVRVMWARRVNALHPVPELDKKGQPKKNFTLEAIDTLLIALILVFGLIRPFVLKTFYIPSESMVPTLQVKDMLIANMFVLHTRLPERGEVIVFEPPMEAIIGSNPELTLRALLEDGSQDAINAVDPQLLPAKRDILVKLPQYPGMKDDYIKRVVG
jgi:signal peptidase I